YPKGYSIMIRRRMSEMKIVGKLLSLEQWKRWSWSLVRLTLITGLSFVILFPIIQKISTALKDTSAPYSPIVVWIPATYTLENFKLAMSIMNYWKTLF